MSQFVTMAVLFPAVVANALIGLLLAEKMRGDLRGRQLIYFRIAWAVIGLPGFIVIGLGGLWVEATVRGIRRR